MDQKSSALVLPFSVFLAVFGKAFFLEGILMRSRTYQNVNAAAAPVTQAHTFDLSLLPSEVRARIADKTYTVFPGFCDVHVHFREPGFSYKERIATGSLAAAHGGYTAVCTMPNLSPCPDSVQALEKQLEIIRRDAVVRVCPYGTITIGEQGKELSDMEGMAVDAVAYSDDGKGVQTEDTMRSAMQKTALLGKVLAAHCEDDTLLHGGYIHDGQYAKSHGHKGICSESEWRPIERDLRLAEETGCRYHVCHISCKESVGLIRNAKHHGVDVTCETAPHYLVLDENDLREDGRFKMNPPLRSSEDREALLEGIRDGTIDMIATDHAPHSREEKSKGLAGSAFGVVGLETAFPVLYSELVRKGVISMERLLELMVYAPRKRFSIPLGGDYTVWDLERQSTVDPGTFLSMGKATPFEGRNVFGVCIATVSNGRLAYRNDSI